MLVVDRYGGYNKTNCRIQYCYAHLLRDVQDLEKEFPEEVEISTFVTVVAPLLSLAMSVRLQSMSDKEFYRKAKKLSSEIEAAMNKPALIRGFAEFRNLQTKRA